VNSFNLLPIFFIGLLGSVHCVGMCGGIVAAFSVVPPQKRTFPVAVVTTSGVLFASDKLDTMTRVLAYNAGRIASYAAAGAVVGGFSGGMFALANMSALQTTAYFLANLMLVALGLYLMDAWRGLVVLERAGQVIWRHVQPLTIGLLPIDSKLKMFGLGALWGWLPCGMVYSVLLTALLSGSASAGASVMLAFGLGTLPTLLLMGLFGAQMRNWMQRRAVRLACGLVILSFGLFGLVQVVHGPSMHWFDSFCISPASSGGIR
jgi:sulfite exporter TauE/SafE